MAGGRETSSYKDFKTTQAYGICYKGNIQISKDSMDVNSLTQLFSAFYQKGCSTSLKKVYIVKILQFHKKFKHNI